MIKGAKIVSLEAAHISNVEQPKAYTEAVLNFLKRLGERMDEKERLERGRSCAPPGARRRLGRPLATKNRNAFNAEWQDVITASPWGDIWTRPHFDERTRRVLVMGTMIALGRWEEFKLHVRGALTDGGFSADDIKEIILQQASYCGVPAGNHALRGAEEVLKEPASCPDGKFSARVLNRLPACDLSLRAEPREAQPCPKVRKEMPDVALTRDKFARRLRERFPDPASSRSPPTSTASSMRHGSLRRLPQGTAHPEGRPRLRRSELRSFR